MLFGHTRLARTETKLSNAVQHRGDCDDGRDLEECIEPEIVGVRQVLDQQDGVDVQHERAERLLSERDKNDLETTGDRPAPPVVDRES